MLGTRSRSRLVMCAGWLFLGSLTLSCSSSKATPPPARAPELWGTFKPVVSVKELMRDMLDPIADNIFDSVSIVVDRKGTVETAPHTDEDWEKIRIGATTLAEGVVSAEGSEALRSAWRFEQQYRSRCGGIGAGSNHGQSRS